MRYLRILPVLALGAIGCAGSMSPTPTTHALQASLEAARAAGARNDFTASFYLAVAEQKTADAALRRVAGDEASARRLELRAAADVEIAAMIMQERATRGAARRAVDEVDMLQTRLGENHTTRAPAYDRIAGPATSGLVRAPEGLR